MFQYVFLTGVSNATAPRKFIRRIEFSLAKKKKNSSRNLFLDIVGAFNNITHKSIGDALRELKVSPFLVRWIENSLRHRTV